MIALIALQSMTVVLDVHQFHQSGLNHILTNSQLIEIDPISAMDVDSDWQFEDAKSIPGDVIDLDCDHCCHCHGMMSFFVVNGFKYDPAMSLSDKVAERQISYFSFFTLPDSPPPIGKSKLNTLSC